MSIAYRVVDSYGNDIRVGVREDGERVTLSRMYGERLFEYVPDANRHRYGTWVERGAYAGPDSIEEAPRHSSVPVHPDRNTDDLDAYIDALDTAAAARDAILDAALDGTSKERREARQNAVNTESLRWGRLTRGERGVATPDAQLQAAENEGWASTSPAPSQPGGPPYERSTSKERRRARRKGLQAAYAARGESDPAPRGSLTRQIDQPNILQEAQAAVYGDREAAYGHPRDDFGRIASLWNGYLDARAHSGTVRDLGPGDVASMMILLKMARLLETPSHRDSIVDMAGYAACLARAVGVDV